MNKKNNSLFNQRNFVILKALAHTDYKLRYQGSLLGHVWDIVKPVLLFATRFFIFAKFLGLGNGVKNFHLSLFLGMILWTFFQETTVKGMTSIVARKDIVRKANVPSIIIVLSTTIGAIINFGINLSIVLLFIILSGVPVTIWWLMIIPLFIELLLLSLGVTFILSALYVRFRDMAPLWEIFLQIKVYLTPIIYPIIRIVRYSSSIATLLMISPLSQIIQDARYFIVDSDTIIVSTFITNPFIVVVPYLLPIILFIVGIVLFQKYSKRFPEIL